jgi:hypothetical protein
MKKLPIVILAFGMAYREWISSFFERRLCDRKWSLNDGQIQNPSNPFGIVPLSNFAPRGFGFVHHSIAILYHEVPNPNLTIRDFSIAVRRRRHRRRRDAGADAGRAVGGRRELRGAAAAAWRGPCGDARRVRVGAPPVNVMMFRFSRHIKTLARLVASPSRPVTPNEEVTKEEGGGGLIGEGN